MVLGTILNQAAGDDLSESFYLIPTGPETPLSTLKRENTFLKREVDEMQKRLAVAERVLQLRKEQDQQLRDSIVLARQQVRFLLFLKRPHHFLSI